MRSALILAIALVMGLGAAYLAREWAGRQQTATPAVAIKTVVVTTARIGFGAELNGDNISEIAWPASNIPDGAFATKADLFKEGRRRALVSMGRNEPVLSSKISGPGQRATLSALLQEGHRAVSVRVDDVRGVAGFVLPGDHVDVVWIRELRKGNETESTSNILVQRVKVLAVDQAANEGQEQATVAKAVTLEVTTVQAQKILLASNIGRLSLILRQAGHANPEATRQITETDLGTNEAMPITQHTPKSVAPGQQPGNLLNVIRGSKRQSYGIGSDPAG